MWSPELVEKTMKERGKRMTWQRRILIEIVLEGKCRCCKEVYYEAIKKDETIGVATVYRTMNALEEIGVISRNYLLLEPEK